LALLCQAVSFAQAYRAERVMDHGVAIVRLSDPGRGIEVSIVPSIGNRAYEMKAHGNNILYFPYADVEAFQARPQLSGIPFLAPWADLLDEQAFWANGRKYVFNMDLGNVRGRRPSHGLLVNSPRWQVVDVGANANSAHVTSRLDFWRYPELAAQWPFAHEYEMTYRLAGGELEIETTITNLSDEPMPLAIGYHPYLQIPGIPRDEWLAHYPARVHVIPGEYNIPTGEMRALDLPNPLPLRGRTLDDGFTDFQRDENGRAHFAIEAQGKRVEVLFGPKYPVATIWFPAAPPGETRDFLCFEPLTTIINGLNLAQQGKYKALQSVPARGKWTESFWIRSSGI
jgi:aldose 1-epimerase